MCGVSSPRVNSSRTRASAKQTHCNTVANRQHAGGDSGLEHCTPCSGVHPARIQPSNDATNRFDRSTRVYDDEHWNFTVVLVLTAGILIVTTMLHLSITTRRSAQSQSPGSVLVPATLPQLQLPPTTSADGESVQGSTLPWQAGASLRAAASTSTSGAGATLVLKASTSQSHGGAVTANGIVPSSFRMLPRARLYTAIQSTTRFGQLQLQSY